MPDPTLNTSKPFLVTVALSPSELGLYAAIRQAKRLSNEEAVSAMVAFCLQALVSETSTLSAECALEDDIERTVLNHAAHAKQLGSLLAGAEKILLDAAALREQLAQQKLEAA